MKTEYRKATISEFRNGIAALCGIEPETRRKVVFDYDQEPDLSWLDQDEFKNEDKANHIALSMLVFEMGVNDDDWKLIDSLGGIDCLADKDDWATGTFYKANALPEGYLRELAINAGLKP